MTEQEMKIEAFRALIGGAEWQNYFIPQLQSFKEMDTILLTHVRQNDNGLPDMYLRGRLAVYDWVLNGIEKSIREYDSNLAKLADEESASGLPEGLGSPYDE